MATTLTVTLANGVVGPSPEQNGMVKESVVITPNGTADGDVSAAYTPQFLKPDRVLVGGNLEYSIANGAVTFKATAAIDDNNLINADIIGYAG